MITKTDVYERREDETSDDWRVRAGAKLGEVLDLFDDGQGDPERMVITTVSGGRLGYSITLTLTRNETVDKSSEEA